MFFHHLFNNPGGFFILLWNKKWPKYIRLVKHFGCGYTDVSENSGTPKSSILIRFSIKKHPLWGTTWYHYFWKHPHSSPQKSIVSAKSLEVTGRLMAGAWEWVICCCWKKRAIVFFCEPGQDTPWRCANNRLIHIDSFDMFLYFIIIMIIIYWLLLLRISALCLFMFFCDFFVYLPGDFIFMSLFVVSVLVQICLFNYLWKEQTIGEARFGLVVETPVVL